MHPPYTIAFSQPDLSDKERTYLLSAFDSTWISSLGPFVEAFETQFAEWVQCKHAMTCCNGTAALHLAMLGLGIGPGDEVIVPSMTYVATANAVRYVGADPVFADVDPNTWTVDPVRLERLVSHRTRAIVAVHLFGVPCDMTALRRVADRVGAAVIEDAAEAHGAQWNDKRVGSWGDIAAFSFYGNKIITTGEGGMVCTDRDDLAARVRRFRAQGSDPERTYWFEEMGYNYRLTNPACAIGLAQLERVDGILLNRRRVGQTYDRLIESSGLPVRGQTQPPGGRRSTWTYGVVLQDDLELTVRELRATLAAQGIETRPFFHPLHDLPMYRGMRRDDCAVSLNLGDRGVLLPCHTQMSEGHVERVVENLSAALTAPERVG